MYVIVCVGCYSLCYMERYYSYSLCCIVVVVDVL